MPRRQKKYHCIYKTTCLTTGRFYLGMHSTDDLDDGYLGSGKILGYSIAKHGKESHKKEILELFTTRALLKKREKELITEELRADARCMNIAPGGGGGFVNDVHRKRAQKIAAPLGGKSAFLSKVGAFSADSKRKRETSIRLLRESGELTHNWSGKNHSAESRERMSISHQGKQIGSKNGKFGTKWMTNGTNSISVKACEIDAYIADGYVFGRRFTGRSVSQVDGHVGNVEDAGSKPAALTNINCGIDQW